MAVAAVEPKEAIKPRTWTRAEYDRLIDLGIFHEDERLELIEGEILEMPSPGDQAFRKSKKCDPGS